MNSNTGLSDLLPSEFYLSQNYPNPFSEKTAIKLCVAVKTRVNLEVFNSVGELVRTLMDEEKEAGTYVYRLQAGDYSATRRMLLLRQKKPPCAPSY